MELILHYDIEVDGKATEEQVEELALKHFKDNVLLSEEIDLPDQFAIILNTLKVNIIK